MPLKKGHGKAAKAANYERLKKEGYPKKQRVAIMLKAAGESRHQKGK
jgi:hypothetical protein